MNNNKFTQCPRCNQAIKDDLRFCPHCGHSLAQQSPPKRCPKCGKIAPQGEKFCSSCGTAYTDDPKSKPSVAISKQKKKLIIISGISLILVIATLLLVFLVIIPAQKETYTVKIYTYCKISNLKERKNHKTTLTIEEGDVLGDLSQYKETTWGTGIYRSTFKGWYTDKEGVTPWNPHTDKVQSDMTIYAVYERDN